MTLAPSLPLAHDLWITHGLAPQFLGDLAFDTSAADSPDRRERENAPAICRELAGQPRGRRLSVAPAPGSPLGAHDEDYGAERGQYDLPGGDPKERRAAGTDGQGSSNNKADQRVPHG